MSLAFDTRERTRAVIIVPDDSRMTARLRRIVTYLLFLTGIPIILAGLIDAASSRTFGSRLFGVILLVIGAGAAAAGADLCRRKCSWGVPLGAAAAFTIALLCLYLIIKAKHDGDLGLMPIGFLVLLMITLSASFVGVVRQNRLSLGRPTKGILGAAAAAVVLVPYWYSTFILPSVATPQLTVAATLDRGDITGDLLALNGTFTMKNEGLVRVDILGSIYSVTASIVTPDGFGRHRLNVAASGLFSGPPSLPFSNYTDATDPVLVRSARVVADGTFLEPHEQITRSFTTYIPKATYDTARLTMDVVVANGRRLHLAQPIPKATSEEATNHVGYWLVRRWPIEETSVVNSAFRGDRLVVTGWYFGEGNPTPAPLLTTYIDRPDRKPSAVGDAYTSALMAEYGVLKTRAVDELDL